MERLALLLARHNVEVQTAWLANHVMCTRQRGGWVIDLDAHLPRAQRLVGVATMLHALELGWFDTQQSFRFPLPIDDRELAGESRRSLRDYRKPYRRALRLLMPDAMVARWQRERVDQRLAAEEAGVDLVDVEARVLEWEMARSVRRRVMPADLAELVVQHGLRRAADITAPAPRPEPAPPRSFPSWLSYLDWIEQKA